MHVPFLDLRREIAAEKDGIDQAIARVFARGRFILGPELDALEAEFASFLGVPYAAGVASGTDALALSLEAAGVGRPGEGDEVITSALSAAFSALAICRAGAIPRFADVDPVTLQIDPGQVRALIGPRTRAILPVHLYGQAGDLSEILDLARTCGVHVIEDACQAHGSRWQGRALGAWGTAAGFSFYPTKNMGAFGDAGMVATSDSGLHQRVKQLRNGGQSRTYHHELLGCNSRLDELQAAVLRLKLARLESGNEKRRKMADTYDAAFARLDLRVLPGTPRLVPNRHLYPVRSQRRDSLQRHLAELGIDTLIHYPIPLPLQPALRRFVVAGQTFPAAEKAARELLSLPLYPGLTADEQEYTIQAVQRFFGHQAA